MSNSLIGNTRSMTGFYKRNKKTKIQNMEKKPKNYLFLFLQLDQAEEAEEAEETVSHHYCKIETLFSTSNSN